MAIANPTKDPSEQVQFRQLLEEAVSKPGMLMKAYVPVTCKRTVIEETTDGNQAETEVTFKRFVFRRNWFMLSQTDGAAYEMAAIPAWDLARALATLNVQQIPFEMLNGNCQGYAKGREISINPVAPMPAKTTFHELAHIELGHTSEAVQDSETLPRDLKEVEAESVAFLCLESLGMDGAKYCRGYIQNWLQGATIPERNAQRIFAAADMILKAGIERLVQGGAE